MAVDPFIGVDGIDVFTDTAGLKSTMTVGAIAENQRNSGTGAQRVRAVRDMDIAYGG